MLWVGSRMRPEADHIVPATSMHYGAWRFNGGFDLLDLLPEKRDYFLQCKRTWVKVPKPEEGHWTNASSKPRPAVR